MHGHLQVTRVRADVSSLLFQSAVPPLVAVRLMHAVALAAGDKFQQYSGKQLKWCGWVLGWRAVARGEHSGSHTHWQACHAH